MDILMGNKSTALALPCPSGSSNGYFVLAFYGLLFGGLLPAIVGRWWYGSRKLTKDGIETETAARYFRAIKENMSADDVVDVLSTTHEFESVPTPREAL
jgi:translocation protein SEC63